MKITQETRLNDSYQEVPKLKVESDHRNSLIFDFDDKNKNLIITNYIIVENLCCGDTEEESEYIFNEEQQKQLLSFLLTKDFSDKNV